MKTLVQYNSNYPDNGTASHPDMQQIRIIGLFFLNRLHGCLKWEKNRQTAVLGYIFIYLQIKEYVIPYICWIIWEKI